VAVLIAFVVLVAVQWSRMVDLLHLAGFLWGMLFLTCWLPFNY